MDYLMDCIYGNSDSSSPRVTLSLGRAVGKVRVTSQGREFVSFTRIPYGKPPVGER